MHAAANTSVGQCTPSTKYRQATMSASFVVSSINSKITRSGWRLLTEVMSQYIELPKPPAIREGW
jgi:hypothetical protein